MSKKNIRDIYSIELMGETMHALIYDIMMYFMFCNVHNM